MMQDVSQFDKFLDEALSRSGTRSPRRATSKDAEYDLAHQSPIFKKLLFRGWTIEPTIHAAAQAYQRAPNLSLSDWKILHKRSIEAIEDQGLGRGEYVFYSRSLEYGYVVAVDNRARKLFRIITVLPRGKNNAKEGTGRIIVEGVEIQPIWIEVE